MSDVEPTSTPTTEPSTEPSTEAPSSESTNTDSATPSQTMPDASIKAANDALSHSLESANIVMDETNTVEGSKVGQDGNKTVFHDQNEFNVKHPLYSPWTLWYESPTTKSLPKSIAAVPTATYNPSGGGWMDNVRPVVSFNSVEEFWGLYNNIVPPSQLPPKSNYFLFKESIIPAWEDDANKAGGKWSVQLPKDKNRQNIDPMWLHTMLAAIGETFETPLPPLTSDEKPEAHEPSPDLITGVILSTRPSFYRLAIWTRFCPGPESEAATDDLLKRITMIGKHFKTAVLGFGEDEALAGGYSTEVEWISHADSEKKDKKSARKIIA